MLESSTKVVPLIVDEFKESLFKIAGVLKLTNFLAGERKELSCVIDRVYSFLNVVSNVN